MSENMITISKKEYNELRFAKIFMDNVGRYNVGDRYSDAIDEWIDTLKSEKDWEELLFLTNWCDPDDCSIIMENIEESFNNPEKSWLNFYNFSKEEFEELKAHYESFWL